MKSRLPKVMHRLLGIPLIMHVIRILESAGVPMSRQVVVTGHGREILESYLSGRGFRTVCQEEQLGTGHAVACTEKLLSGVGGQILIICGDTPLFRPQTIAKFLLAHYDGKCDLSILTAEFDDPTGYGRIVRDENGKLVGITEEKDADENIKAVREVNTGTYIVRGDQVFELLEKVGCENAQGEYYLTDIVSLGLEAGLDVCAFQLASEEEALGVNSRQQLALAEGVLLGRIRDKHMAAGVTFSMPETTYIEPDVEIGKDSIIGSHCVLKGKTRIGESTMVYPFSYLDNFSCNPGSIIGPFAKETLPEPDDG